MPSGVDLVIFGASGDLSRRKILPSLRHLAARNGTGLRVIGAGRSSPSQQEFRDLVNASSGSSELASTAEWVQLNYKDPASFAPVKSLIDGGGVGGHYRAIMDDKDRVQVAICFNMDLGDAWEWADAPEYPERHAGLAFRVGVNYVLYTMTH